MTVHETNGRTTSNMAYILLALAAVAIVASFPSSLLTNLAVVALIVLIAFLFVKATAP